jgi:hypothetical protein
MNARRQIEGPSLAVKLGVGVSGGNTAAPALLAQLELSVRKDVASEVEVEPIFYLAHLGADVSLTPGNERLIDYGEGFVAPAGVRLRHGDSRLEGEALRVLWRRHAQLDQDRLVRVMLLHGAARVTPGWLRYPGQHNLFVQLETELVGYEQIGHVSAREDVHAFYLGEVGVLGGSTLFPHRTLLFSIYGGIGASMALLNRGFHSDIGARAGATFGMVDGTFAQFFEARYLMSREPEGDMLTAPHFRGGVSVAF